MLRYGTGHHQPPAHSALIIDAMDVLHTGSVDGSCLVSGDSDFTRLATRILEAGLVVYGFRARNTPEPVVVACNKFICLLNRSKQYVPFSSNFRNPIEYLFVAFS